MKKQIRFIPAALILLALSAINLQLSTAIAQGTAFTYQGRLNNGGSPASGSYDVSFALFATNAGGIAVAGPVTNNAVPVTNGLFTVPVDFCTGAFTGQSNWLEIAVATNGTGSFTTLAPRQQLTPTPYAIFAESASGLSGTLPASQLIGDPNGNLFVGPSGNSTTTGSGNSATGESALQYNTTGSNNTANGNEALVANKTGSDNTASGYDALGVNQFGSYNTAVGYQALNNNATGSNNIAVGCQAGMNIYTASSNIDIGNAGTFTDNNVIRIGSGQSQAYIAGVINGNGAGLTNLSASTLASGAATGAGFGNSISSSGATDAFIGGGGANTIQFNSAFSFIGGGANNTNFANAGYSVIGGGTDNQTASGWSFIGGGNGNVIGSGTVGSTIGGGYNNTINGSYATVPGGSLNLASGRFSFAAGEGAQATNSGAFVWSDAEGTFFASTTNNQFSVRAGGGVQFVTGGTGLTVDGLLVTASNLQANGNLNLTSGSAMDLKSATTMQVESSTTTTVKGSLGVNVQCGGNSMDVSPSAVTLTGTLLQFQSPAIMNSMLTVEGLTELAGGLIAYGGVGIGTGSPEQALSVVGGMNVDAGNANNGPVGSGGFNQGGPTNGCLSFGTGSSGTGASGEGIQSKRTSGGTQYDLEFFTGFNKQMVILNNGNVGIGNANPVYPLEMGSGAYCSVAGAWTSVSDRNAKEDFTAIKPVEVLAKVAALPITEWKYKVEADGTRHLGPVAQDFHAAFGLNGADDKHIATVDEEGVALAAIQGLNQKVEEKDAEIADLKSRLEKLEKLMNEKLGGAK